MWCWIVWLTLLRWLEETDYETWLMIVESNLHYSFIKIGFASALFPFYIFIFYALLNYYLLSQWFETFSLIQWDIIKNEVE